ncbi:MAG: CsbD family protein [Acidimicrobiia bacterium]|nr:CsbD family protein [Acidimicrobiia bacterium]
MDSDLKMKWKGRWDQLKGKAKQTWGDLTDDDVDVAEGRWDEFVGNIRKRTGETVETIKKKLS